MLLTSPVCAGLHPSLFCEGKGPFRWAALSGDPEDIYKTDEAVLREFPETSLSGVDETGPGEVKFQGCRPHSAGWVAVERARIGKVFNDMVARGNSSPHRDWDGDHLDAGSVGLPLRETEGD